MKSLEEASKKSKKRQCIVHYAGFGPYSELKDVNDEKNARIRAAKAKWQILIAEIIIRNNACLYLMTHKMQHTVFIWPHAEKR